MPTTPTRPPTPRVLARSLLTPLAATAGEPPYVAELWQLALAGMADLDLYCGGTLVSAFELRDAFAHYREAVGTPVVMVWCDADGVVFSRAASFGEYEVFKMMGEAETTPIANATEVA